MKRVFISHPYASNPQGNKEKVDKICKEVLKMGYLPISPLHMFGYMEDDEYRQEVLKSCYDTINYIADDFWMFGYSDGCQSEHRKAKFYDKPVKYCEFVNGKVLFYTKG